ncbi:hypothetical protein KP509_36G044500 [Ceratopteris richardii]|uniref:Uncharacterized protein n=1 Tax=Ceratopteris richardii TaxID=49495 RepID=A0A8T2QCG1_CERRI|nr:hypothetical protein KP509_36G044500 [Ceratopteris richardii]
MQLSEVIVRARDECCRSRYKQRAWRVHMIWKIARTMTLSPLYMSGVPWLRDGGVYALLQRREAPFRSPLKGCNAAGSPVKRCTISLKLDFSTTNFLKGGDGGASKGTGGSSAVPLDLSIFDIQQGVL